jgi:two-component system phosphate regulon sensor histidine kinase PhoR
MLRKGLTSEIRWFLLFIAVFAFLGFSLDYFQLSITLGLAAYILWTFMRLRALEAWVMSLRKGRLKPNLFNGIWGEVAEDIRLIHQRFEKDRLRLQAVVARVQDMTSALSDGVILLDNRGNIEWWNEAAARMFGFKEVDLGNKASNILRDPLFQQYFESGNYEEPLDLESSRLEGQHLQYQVHPYGQGEYLIVVRDITRVFKLEQMRRDFVANVSHELRTPLTVIRGYVETLLGAPNLPPVVERSLEQMQGQGQRMTALINDLITLTKLETDDRGHGQDHIDLNTLAQSIINDAKALATGAHRFSIEVPESLHLKGREKEIRSALSNLVFNAVKYSPDGGEIQISTEQKSDEIAVHVTDYGLGIDPKHIPRLTERFYRVDSGRASTMGGTGLGLAIVKHVLLRHDGTLSIKSKLGKGSTFSAHFPLERLTDEPNNPH